MYIWWLLKFLVVFFVEIFTKPCSYAKNFQLVSQQSLASIYNKHSNILIKRPSVAITVPSGTQRHHWGIGISGFTFGCSIEARAIPPLFLGLCSPLDCRQSIASPMGVPTFSSTEKAHTFTIYDCILRIRPKKCYITKANFHKKMIRMNLQYFCIFMYIWWLLKFFSFFSRKLTKPCCHAGTFQLVRQQFLAKINNSTPTF